MAWAKNGTPSTSATPSITDLTAKKFNIFLINTHQNSGVPEEAIRFNNNSNSVYAWRYQQNGLTDTTGVSDTSINNNPSAMSYEDFNVVYTVSISGQEKLVLGWLYIGSAGAGFAGQRTEFVGKFVPSPDADITRIDILNVNTGDYSSNSNLSALGTD